MSAKKLVSSALLISMLISLAACGGEAEETTAAVTTAAEAVEDAPKELKPDMPDDLRFEGGVINCYGMQSLVEGASGTEDTPVNVLKQELYDRNKRVEERFGITLNFTNVGDSSYRDTMTAGIRQSVNSGSADYDVVFSVSTVINPLINEGMFIPVSDLPWVDLDKPWWNKGYIENISFNQNDPYILFGNLTYNQVERTTAVFANVTQLEAQHNIVADDLYDLVLDGKWTLDKFAEIVNLGYKDENGDTKKNVGDMFGMVYTTGAVNWTAFGSGLSFSGRDEEGFPTLTMNNERSVDLVEKLISIYSRNNAVIFLENKAHANEFAAGKALFMPNRLFLAGWNQLREMKDDFVILPYPKFDETIDGYHDSVESLVQWGAVTSTVDDADLAMISAALEQMDYDGYNTVTPLYYENELKLKYTRGDDLDKQSQIIDIIVEGARTDFICSNTFTNLTNIFTNCVDASNNIFASLYAQREPAALASLNALIESYEAEIYE